MNFTVSTWTCATSSPAFRILSVWEVLWDVFFDGSVAMSYFKHVETLILEENKEIQERLTEDNVKKNQAFPSPKKKLGKLLILSKR